jgi:hypothetical protein
MPAGRMSGRIIPPRCRIKILSDGLLFFPCISKKMSLPEFSFSWCAPCSHSRRLIRQHQCPPDTPVHILFFSRTHKKARNAPSMTSTMRMRRGGFSRWYSGPIMNPSKRRPNEKPMRIAVRTTPGVRYVRRTKTHCSTIGAHG